jgi:uncharacterized FlaG/YvyC family protein
LKIPSLHELKQELQNRPPSELLEYCLRLVRFKQENKELMSYLLFESNDLATYIEKVREETRTAFQEVNKTQLYFAKKNLRRILRQLNKHIRYTASRQAETEWLLNFCTLLAESGIDIKKSPAIHNIMKSQIKKIEKAMEGLHEDLQYDYRKPLKELQVWK